MFNKIRGFRRRTKRFVLLVWRDQAVVALIILFITTASTSYGAYLGYQSQLYSMAMIDAGLAGTLLGFALFQALSMFRWQAQREHFQEWAQGCLSKMTQEANAAMAEEALKHAGGENAERPNRLN